jgi:hypothetical protein
MPAGPSATADVQPALEARRGWRPARHPLRLGTLRRRSKGATAGLQLFSQGPTPAPSHRWLPLSLAWWRQAPPLQSFTTTIHHWSGFSFALTLRPLALILRPLVLAGVTPLLAPTAAAGDRGGSPTAQVEPPWPAPRPRETASPPTAPFPNTAWRPLTPAFRQRDALLVPRPGRAAPNPPPEPSTPTVAAPQAFPWPPQPLRLARGGATPSTPLANSTPPPQVSPPRSAGHPSLVDVLYEQATHQATPLPGLDLHWLPAAPSPQPPSPPAPAQARAATPRNPSNGEGFPITPSPLSLSREDICRVAEKVATQLERQARHERERRGNV